MQGASHPIRILEENDHVKWGAGRVDMFWKAIREYERCLYSQRPWTVCAAGAR
jgi:hypothetical protein